MTFYWRLFGSKNAIGLYLQPASFGREFHGDFFFQFQLALKGFKELQRASMGFNGLQWASMDFKGLQRTSKSCFDYQRAPAWPFFNALVIFGLQHFLSENQIAINPSDDEPKSCYCSTAPLPLFSNHELEQQTLTVLHFMISSFPSIRKFIKKWTLIKFISKSILHVNLINIGVHVHANAVQLAYNQSRFHVLLQLIFNKCLKCESIN